MSATQNQSCKILNYIPCNVAFTERFNLRVSEQRIPSFIEDFPGYWWWNRRVHSRTIVLAAVLQIYVKVFWENWISRGRLEAWRRVMWRSNFPMCIYWAGLSLKLGPRIVLSIHHGLEPSPWLKFWQNVMILPRMPYCHVLCQ